MSAKTNKTVCQKSSNENSCRITFTTINYKERQNWTLLKNWKIPGDNLWTLWKKKNELTFIENWPKIK